MEASTDPSGPLIPIERLTPRQRDCLRLVPTRNSKEIGQVLGISNHVVDKHIKAAMRTLGVGSRLHAARILFEHEASPVQSLGPQPSGMPKTLGSGLAPAGDGGSDAATVLREERAEFTASLPPAHQRLRHALSGLGGNRNDLTALQKLVAALLIALAILVIVVLLLTSSDALTRIFWRVALNQT